MEHKFEFTFANLKREYQRCLELGYSVITCHDFIQWKKNGKQGKVLVNRVDVDLSIKKTDRLIDIFASLGIPATFFIRLHAPEYNPFSFEGYRIIRKLIDAGHEVGYHSEVVDEALIWKEDARSCLLRDIEVFNRMFGVEIKGVASHGGMTGNNNLDFWKAHHPGEFGLVYEAYDRNREFNLFWESRYVSDSEWTRWKAYENGQLMKDDRRAPSQHALDEPQVLHTLIHPDTYFESHFYE